MNECFNFIFIRSSISIFLLRIKFHNNLLGMLDFAKDDFFPIYFLENLQKFVKNKSIINVKI